ncbi:hypothetical protein [Euzebya tangerina]|uniref:hypothetical protein n=1 Tax=Euzebya tangerina TaxID=591198 RepID=UPI000E30EF30|nr:hypothetical protein [Euzebya tangerina]
MAIHTCPRCPLRFVTSAELVDHMDHDHHVPHEMLEQIRYPGVHEVEPLYRAAADQEDTHTILIVANQTIGSGSLGEVLEARQREHGDLAVFLVVPATPSTHLVASEGLGHLEPGQDVRSDDVGVAQARWRLRKALSELRALGIPAHGSVGDPDPFVAAGRALQEEPVTEILVCTLEPGISRWLKQDLPAALERRSGLPVTTITVEPAFDL